MSDNSKPVYDNPKLLQRWEREHIRTCVRFYTDSMRTFLEKQAATEGNQDIWIQRNDARQEHIMEKLLQFQDQHEPEDDDEEEETYEEQLAEITTFTKVDNND